MIYEFKRLRYKEVYGALTNPARIECKGRCVGDIYGGEYVLCLLGMSNLGRTEALHIFLVPGSIINQPLIKSCILSRCALLESFISFSSLSIACRRRVAWLSYRETLNKILQEVDMPVLSLEVAKELNPSSM